MEISNKTKNDSTKPPGDEEFKADPFGKVSKPESQLDLKNDLNNYKESSRNYEEGTTTTKRGFPKFLMYTGITLFSSYLCKYYLLY